MLSILFVAAFSIVLNVGGCSECSKSAKAHTYLEATTDLLDKMKENLASGEDECKCPPKPADCSEVLLCNNSNRSGVYKVWPRNRISTRSVRVYCDMDTDDGGWTVIQRRGDYKRPLDYFQKNWYQYKTGFGDIRRDFWLGNDNIYALTNQNEYTLRIDLSDGGNQTRYAFYDRFWIDNEAQNYKLHVHEYSGDAGDSFGKHSDQMFSTVDRDNDNSTENCVENYKGGWWFFDCQDSNLNALFYGAVKAMKTDGIIWKSWPVILMKTEIKIRPWEFGSSTLDLGVEPK